MEVKLFNKQEGLFNSYCAAHPFGDVLQTTNWGRLKAQSGWSYYPLAVQKEGVILASALILAKKLPFLPHCLFYSPRGPLYSTPAALQALLAAGRELALEKDAVVWKMDPAIPAADSEWQVLAAAEGLQHMDTGLDFGGVQPRFVMVLDLKASLDRLLKEMKSKTRYNIRYGERRGVRVFYGREKKDLAVFYDLLTETAERDNFTIRPFSYFQALRQHLINNQLAQLFLAYQENTPLAGAICFHLGKKAWYVYGASANQKRNLQASHLLQWEMIRWAKGLGCTVYDFRGVSGDLNPENPLYGLYRFKEGYGAKLCEYVGEFDLPIRAGGYTLWRGGLWAHNWLRKKRQKT